MRRIVYLIDQPFDDRQITTLRHPGWIERNWSVEVWDLTPWAHPASGMSSFALGMRIREFAGYYR